MKVKQIAIISAVALVIIGCVIAAGCTSQEAETDPFVGTWYIAVNYSDTNEIQTVTINADGTGKTIKTYNDDGSTEEITFTWKNVGNSKYRVYFEDNSVNTIHYDKDTDTYYIKLVALYTKDGTVNPENPLIGTWDTNSLYAEYTDTFDAQDTAAYDIKVTSAFNADGTGKQIGKLSDGTTRQYTLSWEEDDDYYIVSRDDGSSFLYGYDPTENIMEVEKLLVLNNTELLDKENLIGTWAAEKSGNKVIATLKQDGNVLFTHQKQGSEPIEFPMELIKSANSFILKSNNKNNIAFWVIVTPNGDILISEDYYLTKIQS